MPDYVFEPLPVPAEGEKHMRDIAEAATALLYQIGSKVPRGRCQSLAIANLEQCAMWANKGISHPEP